MDKLEEAAKIADFYAKENFRLATDTILLDPVLRGGSSDKALVVSEDLQMWGCIYSSRAHAAQDIAKAIRLGIISTTEQGKED